MPDEASINDIVMLSSACMHTTDEMLSMSQ